MSSVIKWIVRSMLAVLYRVRIEGAEHYRAAGANTLIVANHTSFLDGVLLTVFLPDRFTFAVNTHIARQAWAKLGLRFVDFFPLDPANPFSLRGLIRHLRAGRRAVIFPEGRITVTGTLMKIYHGPALVADRAGAMLLPVRIEGAQHTRFTRLRTRPRWFPRITLTFLPPRRLSLPAGSVGRARRQLAGRQLAELMGEMIFVTSRWRRTLMSALVEARRAHGAGREIAEDIDRLPATYRDLVTRSSVLGRSLARVTAPGERVGLLLPNVLATLYALFGLSATGRLPAMLDSALGGEALGDACARAGIRVVYSARRYVAAMRLEPLVAALARRTEVRYLEEVRDALTTFDWLAGYARGAWTSWIASREPRQEADAPAALFFVLATNGNLEECSYSHAQLLAGCHQLTARCPFGRQEALLAVLPPSDPLGFLTGLLLPLVSGMRVFLYPAPRQYQAIPEAAYGLNMTVLFARDEQLARYAERAHPYDFHSMRYVFADTRGLRDSTRQAWAAKFGLRLFEVYGVPDTAPLLAVNTPVDYRPGSVGRLLPGNEYRLDPDPGAPGRQRLWVRGPGVRPGPPRPDRPPADPGWRDTGAHATIDEGGFVRLRELK